MPVCVYYNRGYCKFGGMAALKECCNTRGLINDKSLDHCRNEHPGHKNGPVNSRNPFGPLHNSNNSRQVPAARGRAILSSVSGPCRVTSE